MKSLSFFRSRTTLKLEFEEVFLPLLLTVGLLHGLIYLFLMPPWQHHDEPGHFEYISMIARGGSIPERGTYDNAVRKQILQSMVAHGFFDPPWLTELGKNAARMQPVWIGVTQVGDPPLYYWLAALPVRLLLDQPVEVQLYAARFVSLLLWLGVLVIAWWFARQLTPPRHPLRFLLPLSLALLPSFVDHSVAANNDIAATFVYSLILLFGFRLIQNGVRPVTVFMLVLLLVASYFTKASIWLSVFVIPLAFILSLLRKRQKTLWVGGLLVLVVAGFFALFECSEAALWYRDSTQQQPTRAETSYGLAYQLIDERSDRSNALYQTLVPFQPDDQSAQSLTVGGWMWGTGSGEAFPPSLMVLTRAYQRIYLRPAAVRLTQSPAFYSTSFSIPKDALRVYALLQPFGAPQEVGVAYYQDPFVLPEHEAAAYETHPAPSAPNERPAMAGAPNWVRNAGATATWPRFRPGVVQIFNRIDPRISEAADWLLYTLDLQGSFWYTQESFLLLARSFWGRFSWGQIWLVGSKPFRLPLWFSVIGLAASAWVFLRQYRRTHGSLALWSAFAIFCVAFYAWFTGISSQSLLGKPVLPDARYMYPVVILLMGGMAWGWSSIIQRCPPRGRPWCFLAYFLFFIHLDILAVVSIRAYYGL